MPEQVPFISREYEIARIDEFIETFTGRQIICIHGEGGVGKTRLFQKIREQQHKKSYLTVTEIIDLDEQSLLNPESFDYRIVNMFDPKVFAQFTQAQVEYDKLKMSQATPERLEEERERITQTFVSCFNTESNHKRVLLFLDTTDHLEREEGKEVWTHLQLQIPKLKNVTILMTGRNAKSIGQSLQQNPDLPVEIIDLQPFSEKDSQKYLQQKQRQKRITLEPELADKLIILSDGRPILLDLAVEWRTRGISLDWVVYSRPEEIYPLDESHKREFEKQLVSYIKYIRQPMDQLVLVLSYIHHLNIEMLSELLKDEDSQTLFKEAISYVFVKQLPNGYISLHDEMRRMVTEHVWPEIDEEGERRQWYSELILNYLSPRIQILRRDIDKRNTELRKREEKKKTAEKELLKRRLKITELAQNLWELRELEFEHTLVISIDKGIKLFVILFDKAINSSRFPFCKKLFDKLQKYEEKLSLTQKCMRDIQKAKLFFGYGDYKLAKDFCKNILKCKDILPQHQVEILLLLGNIDIRLGSVEEKGIADFKKALEIAESHNLPIWVIKAKNALGWAYRNIGNFEDATKYYKEAHRLCLQEGGLERKELQDDYGWISNNLIFVLSYDFETRQTAETLALSTIQHWQRIGNDIGLGAAYLVLGIVYYRKKSHKQALEAFQKALDIFEPLKHNDWLGQIYSWRGALHYDTEEIDKAEEDLKKSLEIGSLNIRAMTLNRLGRVCLIQKNWDMAKEYLEESIKCAKEIPDYISWLLSMARLPAIAAEKGEYERLKGFEQMLQDCLENIKNPQKISLGVAYIGLARLAFGQNDISQMDDIVKFLKKGFTLLIEHAVYSRTDIFKRLEPLEKDFDMIEPEIIRSVGKALQEYVHKKEYENIGYGAVAPIIYRWATWKGEESSDEE